MGRSRSRQALSANALDAVPANDRVAQLEAQLKAAQQELERVKQTSQDDGAGYAQTLARLSQSERGLSQTRAKLVNAETQTQEALARSESLTAQLQELRSLAESLSRDSAAGADECAKLNEALRDAEARATRGEARASEAEARLSDTEQRLSDAEAREREALIAAEDARDERAALQAELESLRCDRGDNSEAQRKLAAAEARLDTLTHERVRLLELLASLEVLGREITHLTLQAAPQTQGLPKVEEWLGRDVEAEHVRATLRPEAFSAPPPEATRTWSTPEIVIDGVKLES